MFILPRRIDCIFGHHLVFNSRVLRSYYEIDLLSSTKICCDEHIRKKRQWRSDCYPSVLRPKVIHEKYMDTFGHWPDLRGQQLTYGVKKIDTIASVSSRAIRSFHLQASRPIRGWNGASNWSLPPHPALYLWHCKRPCMGEWSRPAAAPKHVMHLLSWWHSVNIFEVICKRHSWYSDSECLAHQGASIDMHADLLRSPLDLKATWS